jgi:retron-type reverse transcriptase
LKNGKSSNIPIHVIKKLSEVIAPHLAKYFNKCLQEGHFPDELKTGRISPIYKKEDEQLLENYRPVSTLPVFGKILQKLIYSRLHSFLISKGIIHENQLGFRKGHSTSHALNYSVEHIQSLIKTKEHVLGIFIDLSKAFDTIDHRKLTMAFVERPSILSQVTYLIV